jgi:hypothetical protein
MFGVRPSPAAYTPQPGDRISTIAARQSSAADVQDINVQLAANTVEATTAIVRRHIGTLSQAEQREVTSALAHPSPAGRVSYIRGLAGQG